ncbi:hypothetical protein [Streptomyces sp. 769]|uniref:hypothetical protein n=1 Tax=Streptomyces sp. 769 TaxID=1262452 RepID=UPI000581EF51|nr:hypothetical protein [Streptomyces sp. 769]AJC55113.1 hypothetical protein GZL_02522 [Streptomyces sp. 769]
MTTTTSRTDGQNTLRDTPHPLARIGAHVIASFADVETPAMVTSALFQEVMSRLMDAAVTAALLRDGKAENGFLLKCSHSLWPNSDMNHPFNAKRDDTTVTEKVRAWRTMPAPDTWPGAACALCGHQAVGFYGKADMMLAASVDYRNTTPRGHAGTALCWPCICCFYAAPYGCYLTGGRTEALHTWDDGFLAEAVDLQVSRNEMLMITGKRASRTKAETLALQTLRRYDHETTAGIELVIFNNNNKGQALDTYAVDQPLAEWLRKSSRKNAHRDGFPTLVRAFTTPEPASKSGGQKTNATTSGVENLAWACFHRPWTIPRRLTSYIVGRSTTLEGPTREATPAANLLTTYLHEVLNVNETDLQEIRDTAARIALLFTEDDPGGKLTGFYTLFQRGNSARLRAWLQRHGITWILDRPTDESELVTSRGFEILFSPAPDSYSWYYREYLLACTISALFQRGWRPRDAEKAAQDFDPDTITAKDIAVLDDTEADPAAV